MQYWLEGLVIGLALGTLVGCLLVLRLQKRIIRCGNEDLLLYVRGREYIITPTETEDQV